jgi:hypothetical protein
MLTPKMLKFIDLYIEAGGRQQERCAILAGYAPSGAAAIASRLLRRPDVLRVIRHITETVIQGDVLASANVLRQIRDDAEAETGERRKAASELLDRAGMLIAKVSTVNHVIEDHRMFGAQAAETLRNFVETLVKDRLVTVNDEDRLRSYLDVLATPTLTDADYEEIEDEPEPLAAAADGREVLRT